MMLIKIKNMQLKFQLRTIYLIIAGMFLSVLSGYAQKQTFGVVSYIQPKGWQPQQGSGGLQLSVSDAKSGAYAIAVILKAKASEAMADENFKTDWDKLVKGTVQVDDEPTMEKPVKENGWDVVSGMANYTDGGNKGMVSLISATSKGQTVCVTLMTNTNQYQNDLVAFLNSLELAKPMPTKPANVATAINKKGNVLPSVTGNTKKTTTKRKQCKNCVGGYNLCGICGGGGRVWQQEQSYNMASKQYEYTRVMKTCTFCGGLGRKMCTVCGGLGSTQ